MKSLYIKKGWGTRLEKSGSEVVTLAIRESGEARASERLFEARNVPADLSVTSDPERGRALIERLRDFDDVVFRLALAWGGAEHELRLGDETREWRTEEARLSMSLRGAGIGPVDLELGAVRVEEIDLDPLETVAARLRGNLVSEVGKDSLEFLSLSSPASVLLTTELMRMPGVRVIQDPREGTLDGEGEPVVHCTGDTGGLWPNVVRPSFRVRPIRMPIDAMLDLPLAGNRVEIVEGGPILALDGDRDEIRLVILAGDESNLLPVRLSGPRSKWLEALRRKKGERRWFPSTGGGVWGESLIVSSAELELEILSIGVE